MQLRVFLKTTKKADLKDLPQVGANLGDEGVLGFFASVQRATKNHTLCFYVFKLS